MSNILLQPALWDASPTVQLIELHRAGKSFGEIAAVLGITRNAAAGKCTRLGLTAVTVGQLLHAARTKAGKANAVRVAALPKPVVAKPKRREYTKSELRAMLSEAVANTARLAA